jgi:hypothetical protein
MRLVAINERRKPVEEYVISNDEMEMFFGEQLPHYVLDFYLVSRWDWWLKIKESRLRWIVILS